MKLQKIAEAHQRKSDNSLIVVAFTALWIGLHFVSFLSVLFTTDTLTHTHTEKYDTSFPASLLFRFQHHAFHRDTPSAFPVIPLKSND